MYLFILTFKKMWTLRILTVTLKSVFDFLGTVVAQPLMPWARNDLRMGGGEGVGSYDCGCDSRKGKGNWHTSAPPHATRYRPAPLCAGRGPCTEFFVTPQHPQPSRQQQK